MNITITGSTMREIVDSIEDSVHRGDLPSGIVLPSVRVLAGELSVSPATVAAAYRDLRLRGIVSARTGSGTTIAARPALATPARALIADPRLRDLSEGNPDPALLPDLGPALRAISTEPALYGSTSVDRRLAELVTQWYADVRAGRGDDSFGLCITGGALDAIERVLRVRCRIGDEVAVEDPSYAGVLDLLRGMGLQPVGFAVDDEGPVPEDFERALGPSVHTAIVTPRAQNPTGAAITERRARALRKIMKARPNVHVIENDYFSELAGVPHHPLAGKLESWSVVRSASKLLGPDLRIAALVGDPRTVSRVRGTQQLGTAWVSHLLQRLVVALWEDPATAERFATATRTYATRRQRLIDDLAAVGIQARGCTGLNVVVPVVEEAPVVQLLATAGWQVRSGERHRINAAPFVRITTSALTESDSARIAASLASYFSPDAWALAGNTP